jgi:hypothetical protein
MTAADFREQVPEVLNYPGGGTAATAVTRPSVARENIGAGPDGFVTLSVAGLIEHLTGRHYVSRAYKGKARRS